MNIKFMMVFFSKYYSFYYEIKKFLVIFYGIWIIVYVFYSNRKDCEW